MKIGLLQCDHVNDEYMDIDGDYPDMFKRLFAQHTPDMTIKVYDVINGQFPESPYECDGYIVSGSRYSVYDDIPWIHDLADFVRKLYEAQRPTVGICFGHQMLAYALGGEVKKTERGWGIGVREVKIDNPQSWMQPDLQSFNLLYSHQDQVESLPDNGTILGGNDQCPIGFFSIGEHMLGIQGHPEFSAKYLDTLMSSRIERIGKELIEDAQSTLDTPQDDGIVATWVEAFFAQTITSSPKITT